MADRIVDLLTLAGVLALVALPVAVLVIGVLVWINRRRARAIKDWAARHGDLKRRLADVEALRKRDQWDRGVMELDGVTSREQAERLARHRGRLRLEAANSAYPPLELHQCGDVQIWGVAIHVIHALGRHG